MNGTIVITPRLIAIAIAALTLVLVVAIPGARDVVATASQRMFDPVTVANASVLVEQRSVAERGIQDAHLRARDQLARTRALTLPITQAQAAAIEARYVNLLNELRRTALTSLAEVLGLRGAERERYVVDAEARVAGGSVPATGGVILAPALGEIVARTNALAAELADAGTRELAGSTSPSPSPGASPR